MDPIAGDIVIWKYGNRKMENGNGAATRISFF
jgi:hypothetical protein